MKKTRSHFYDTLFRLVPSTPDKSIYLVFCKASSSKDKKITIAMGGIKLKSKNPAEFRGALAQW